KKCFSRIFRRMSAHSLPQLVNTSNNGQTRVGGNTVQGSTPPLSSIDSSNSPSDTQSPSISGGSGIVLGGMDPTSRSQGMAEQPANEKPRLQRSMSRSDAVKKYSFNHFYIITIY